MPKYCDSEVLESNWFKWIIADAVPILDQYRQFGNLWTKVVGKVVDPDGKIVKKRGKFIDDPNYTIRLHCIGINHGVFIITDANEISICYNENMRICGLPCNMACDIEEFDPTDIENAGYRKEQPVTESWGSILNDIYKMCNGISMKFNMHSDEDRNDLANEAVLQVMRKLKNKRLIYIPGKAPVFNLLTTTIYRCMFSALGRDRRRLKNVVTYVDEIRSQHV